MSTYQVLARKYRPQQFSEVVGQGHIMRTLENAIGKKRIAHAYLFVGPRGTGKTTTARIFAKALNCSESKDPTTKPCDKCSNCTEIMAGTSMDVLEIDGASNNGVDQVRELRETVRYAPAKSRYKIIYIDEVHMVTTQAFNALLKTLEEPPPHVKFLFATTDPQKIPLTILSRCQRFDLHRISNDLIIEHLRHIAKLEKVKISDTALLAIARGAAGGMRDAESALDQIIAFCGDKVEESDVISIFGLAPRDQVQRLTHSVISGERLEVVKLATSLSDEGKDLGRLLAELIEHFRNVLVVQAGGEPTEATADELVELKEHAKMLNRARTLRILEILAKSENDMRWTLSKKILFEVGLLKAIETKDEVLLEEVLKRLKGVQGSLPAAAVEAPRRESREPEPAVKPVRETPAPAARPVERPAVDPSVEVLWKKLLDHTAEHFPMLKSSLVEARPLSLTSDTLTIGFDPEFEFKKEMVDSPKNRGMIEARLRELLDGKAMKVKVVFANDPSIPQGDEPASTSSFVATRSPESEQANKKFDDDPLIKKALEIFKGQIVEMKK